MGKNMNCTGILHVCVPNLWMYMHTSAKCYCFKRHVKIRCQMQMLISPDKWDCCSQCRDVFVATVCRFVEPNSGEDWSQLSTLLRVHERSNLQNTIDQRFRLWEHFQFTAMICGKYFADLPKLGTDWRRACLFLCSWQNFSQEMSIWCALYLEMHNSSHRLFSQADRFQSPCSQLLHDILK